MDYKKEVKKVLNKGYTIINDVFFEKELEYFKKSLDKILKKRILKNEVVGHTENQVIYNYFYENPKLLKLISIDVANKILKELLDEDFVLQSSNAQNRLNNLISKNVKLKNFYKIGASWHTDSRYIRDKKLDSGFSYLVIVALEDFNKNNGATIFIPMSFKKRGKPPRNLNIKFKTLNMKKGSICIMDTGMWHKAGDSSSNSRWSIFSIYTKWFVKPYFNYQTFIKNKKIKNEYKKLLHFYCQPPEINEFRNTLTQPKY